MDNYLFLSYRSLEREVAIRIAADLKDAGLSVWMDCLDQGIHLGDDWVMTLQEQLNHCRGLVALVSPDYVRSRYCRDEMRRARQLEKLIVPVVIAALDPEDWPFEIQSEQHLDLSHWREATAYRTGIDKLTRELCRRFELPALRVPDPETRFLNRLIAELEAARGVLEYVDLETDVDVSARKPQSLDEWGFDAMIKSPAHPAGRPARSLADLVEAWDEAGRLALLGGPGSGKTTTLRRLALTAAHERVARGRLAPLPLVVPLPMWPRSEPLAGFLDSQWPFEADLDHALRAGEALLFLDGLNEMGVQGPARAQELRDWLARPDAPARVLVTCREADYAALDLDIFKGRLGSLGPGGVEALARSHLGDGAGDFLARIEKSASAFGNWWHKGRDDFLRTPYFLSALLFLYQHLEKDDFPSSSGEIMLRLLQAMWAREERRKTIIGYSFDKCIRDLSRVAYRIIESGSPLTLSKRSFEQLLREDPSCDSAVTLDAAMNLGVLHQDMDVLTVRFEHQLFVEFFAAYTLAAVPLTHRVLAATRSPIWSTSSSQPGWMDTSRDWTEALVAAAGLKLLDSDAIGAIARKNAYLASRCARARGSISDTIRGEIERQLAGQTSEAQTRMDGPGIPGSASLRFERHTDAVLERELAELARVPSQ